MLKDLAPLFFVLIFIFFLMFVPVLAQEQTSVVERCMVLAQVLRIDSEKSHLYVRVDVVNTEIDSNDCNVVNVSEVYRLTGGVLVGPPPEPGIVFSSLVRLGNKTKKDGSSIPILRWEEVTPNGQPAALGTLTGDVNPVDITSIVESPTSGSESELVKPHAGVSSNQLPTIEKKVENNKVTTETNPMKKEVERILLEQNIVDTVVEIEADKENYGRYVVKGKQKYKFFFIIHVYLPVRVLFDLTTKTVVEVNKPWWSFLVSKV